MELDPLIPLGATEPRSCVDNNARPTATNSASIVLTEDELAEMHVVPIVPPPEKISRFRKALIGFVQAVVFVCSPIRCVFGWYIWFRIPTRRAHGYKIAPAHGIRKVLFGPVKYTFS